MAAASDWFNRCKAVPFSLFSLPARVDRDFAMELAMGTTSFCPDVVDQGPADGTVGNAGGYLGSVDRMVFWWD